MRELVGLCQLCNHTVYCEDGFLNGAIEESGRLICSDCAKEREEREEQ
ncbi:hypothetical protein [Paenibacillus sp. OV219]|nr:hypothetical protein [Paenibacillus sp. OV219]SEM60957.1 hypothetical protein SAMN05518847_101295 [Paenibacillus sp. OV219]